MIAFDAIILAGGSGERLGGVDKAAISIGGSTLLDRVIEATQEARAVVCVGPERSTRRRVTWTREQPAGGGPVAALSAGLDLVEGSIVALLAVDLPFVRRELVSRLVESCGQPDVDAALAGDEGGVLQPLLAGYRVPPLRARLRAIGSPTDASVSRLIEGLRCVAVPAPSVAQDCDTPEDLERARRKAEELERSGPPTGGLG